MHPAQLEALVAVVETGSFEAAARALHITASAVSQRIKALERHWGRVLVVRATPCRATPEGEALLRLARQLGELQADLAEQLGALGDDGGSRRRLPVVVNADSLATWFVPVLAEAATWEDVKLELLIELEDHGTQHLRTGEAVGAVTSDPAPVPGCTVEPLGVMRYLQVCTPDLLDRHRAARGGPDWHALPMVRFSADDDLQHRLLRRFWAQEPLVQHRIPSSQAFAAAVRAGLGWGLLPEQQLGDAVHTGELVRLRPPRAAGPGAGHVDVHLAWQSWRLGSRRTARLTQAVHRAARDALRRP